MHKRLYTRLLPVIQVKDCWVPVRLRFGYCTVDCYVMRHNKTGKIFLHLKTKVAEYFMYLPQAENQFKDSAVDLCIDDYRWLDREIIKIEAYVYPFQRAYTFLPKYQPKD